MSNADAQQLEALLELFELENSFPVSLETLDEAAYVEPDEPLPAAYASTVESMRAIAYRAGDFTQSGLFDFRVGLHFMARGRYQGAAQAFGWARQQWAFVGDRHLDLLAAYAAALASHRAQQYEEATAAYMDIRRALEREAKRLGAEAHGREAVFRQALESRLKESAGALTAEVRQPAAEAARREPEVLPPVIREAAAAPPAGRAAGRRATIAYRFGRAPAVGDWRDTILPQLEALERVNATLALHWADETVAPLSIAAIALRPALAITVDGLLPETIALLRDLAADEGFAERRVEATAEQAALEARLELRERERQAAEREARAEADEADRGHELERLEADLARIRREVRQHEIASQAQWLGEVTGLLEGLGMAAAAPEHRFATAAALAADLRVLADLLSGDGAGVLEGVSD